MKYIIVPDTSIVSANRGGNSNIVYRDNAGELRTINFEACAENFSAEHKNSSGRCIGERKIDEGYFVLYTSGVKTRIVFHKKLACNPFRRHLLEGTRSARFHALQKLITEAKYSTFDLS